MQTVRFHDFDAFASSISGIESKMLLRNPKHRSWTISRLQLGELELQVGKLGSGNIARGELSADRLMLYLPLTPGIEYSGNGTVMEKDAFCVLEPQCEFCVSTKVEHDWCALSVPIRLLNQRLVDSLHRTCYVTPPNGEAATQFRLATEELISAAAAFPELESSPAAVSAADGVLRLASRLIDREPNDVSREGRPKLSRETIIQRAMQIMEQNADKPVGVGDLAVASNVSERTLRAAFNEYFGVGPNRFLQLRRLHDIRRALLGAEPDQSTVTAILAQHGEWAFSRFASRYRALFGELPSQTLSRASSG